jgi:hypothetical protein
VPAIKKEDLDFSKFVPEVESHLVNIRSGLPGGEPEALMQTLREFPHLTSASITSWSRDPDYQRALEHARQAGDDAREYDRQMAARSQKGGDPFRHPPARGGLDPYAIGNDSSARGGGPTTAPPRHGIRRLLKSWRKIAAENEAAKVVAEATSTEPEPDPLAQRFIALDDPVLPYWAPALAVRRDNVRSADGEASASERAKRIADGTYLPPNVKRGNDGL